MLESLRSVFPAVLLCGWAVTASAQSLPSSQPDVLLIQIEDVKQGLWNEHIANDAGYAAASERAKSAFPYIALTAMTGTPQVWWVTPYASFAKMEEDFESGDEGTAAELARIDQADGGYLSAFQVVHAVGRKDLSHGEFPEAGKHRFYEITTFRVRPGGEAAFEAAAKAYGAAAGRAAPGVSYRVYEVVSGMPSPTYFVFSSTVSIADFDKGMADGMAVMKAFTAQEQEAFAKFAPHSINTQTNRFRLNPKLSYVSRSVRESDPAFWMPKK